MARLIEGTKMPDFSFETPFEKERFIAKTVLDVKGKTAILFLRYYGCTLCQYDIHQFSTQYNKITNTGGQLLIVLQSDPAGLKKQLKPGELPFDIICDPKGSLYERFDIAPAESKAKMADFKTVKKMGAATVGGFKHGEYEGDELQLPAVFVLDKELNLSYVHYGTSAGDVPAPAKLAELM